MIKQAHFFQHVPFEDLGEIRTWLQKQHITIRSTKFYENSNIPDIESIDVLIVMGGPMGVYDQKIYPWLKDETAYIRAAIKKGIYIIGICLGAQLIAHALGSPVTKNTYKEIGWFPVQKAAPHPVTRDVPDTFQAFHWHGDTFALPGDSVHLFKSTACENQAFIYRDRILGLQFHLESNPGSVTNLVDNCKNELIENPYIQQENEIIENTRNYSDNSNRILFTLLDEFLT